MLASCSCMLFVIVFHVGIMFVYIVCMFGIRHGLRVMNGWMIGWIDGEVVCSHYRTGPWSPCKPAGASADRGIARWSSTPGLPAIAGQILVGNPCGQMQPLAIKSPPRMFKFLKQFYGDMLPSF